MSRVIRVVMAALMLLAVCGISPMSSVSVSAREAAPPEPVVELNRSVFKWICGDHAVILYAAPDWKLVDPIPTTSEDGTLLKERNMTFELADKSILALKVNEASPRNLEGEKNQQKTLWENFGDGSELVFVDISADEQRSVDGFSYEVKGAHYRTVVDGFPVTLSCIDSDSRQFQEALSRLHIVKNDNSEEMDSHLMREERELGKKNALFELLVPRHWTPSRGVKNLPSSYDGGFEASRTHSEFGERTYEGKDVSTKIIPRFQLLYKAGTKDPKKLLRERLKAVELSKDAKKAAAKPQKFGEVEGYFFEYLDQGTQVYEFITLGDKKNKVVLAVRLVLPLGWEGTQDLNEAEQQLVRFLKTTAFPGVRVSVSK